MKKLLSLAVASTTLALGTLVTAQAADAPRRAVFAAPPAFSWAGCYVGVNAGMVRDDSHTSHTPSGAYFTAAGGAPPPNALATGLLPGDFERSRHRLEDSAFAGGAQAGCNAQIIGIMVVGVEADIQGTSLKSNEGALFPARLSANPAFTVASRTEVVTSELEWFATARVRAGVAVWERLLIYGTAGFAFGDVKSSFSNAFAPGGAAVVYAGAAHTGARSQSSFGTVVGGGAEWAFFNNWSLKAEYLYMSFPGIRYSSLLTAPAGVAAGYRWGTEYNPNFHVGRVGLNYRF